MDDCRWRGFQLWGDSRAGFTGASRGFTRSTHYDTVKGDAVPSQEGEIGACGATLRGEASPLCSPGGYSLFASPQRRHAGEEGQKAGRIRITPLRDGHFLLAGAGRRGSGRTLSELSLLKPLLSKVDVEGYAVKPVAHQRVFGGAPRTGAQVEVDPRSR